MLHIPGTCTDWRYDTHTLDGTIEYTNQKDNNKSWAIKFDHLYFNKFKVESSDKSYSVVYDKDELFTFK